MNTNILNEKTNPRKDAIDCIVITVVKSTENIKNIFSDLFGASSYMNRLKVSTDREMKPIVLIEKLSISILSV
jgi:hypothetical protein